MADMRKILFMTALFHSLAERTKNGCVAMTKLAKMSRKKREEVFRSGAVIYDDRKGEAGDISPEWFDYTVFPIILFDIEEEEFARPLEDYDTDPEMFIVDDEISPLDFHEVGLDKMNVVIGVCVDSVEDPMPNGVAIVFGKYEYEGETSPEYAILIDHGEVYFDFQ